MSPPPLLHTNAELLALRAGDRECTQRFLKALMPQMHRLLHRLLGGSSMVEDALQEALIELTRALKSFRGDCRLTTFAHRITTRVAYRYFKKAQKARLTSSEPVDHHPARELEARLLARSELSYVRRVVEGLSESRRVAFILCEVEGLSPQEAASVEGVSSLVMRARLSRAKAELRAALKHSQEPSSVLEAV